MWYGTKHHLRLWTVIWHKCYLFLVLKAALLQNDNFLHFPDCSTCSNTRPFCQGCTKMFFHSSKFAWWSFGKRKSWPDLCYPVFLCLHWKRLNHQTIARGFRGWYVGRCLLTWWPLFWQLVLATKSGQKNNPMLTELSWQTGILQFFL